MIKTPVKVEVFATFRKRPDRWGIVDADDKNIDGLWAFSKKSIADFIAHCINQHEEIAVRIEQYKAELEMLDEHLFRDVDTIATREFITEKNSMEAKRLFRICDLIDKERKLAEEKNAS